LEQTKSEISELHNFAKNLEIERNYRKKCKDLMSHRRIKTVHIPKGFANNLLVGSTPKKSAYAGEFAIKEGYATPEN
jgi:dTDP-4-dehydrorhamnose 3,5-epimerase-like enzyme